MTDPRPATPLDADAIAQIHCDAWRETYSGLLPAAEIDRACNLERRRAQWRASTRNADLRITFAEGSGFACIGPQRDPTLLDLGYLDELYAIYVLRKAQFKGLGRALLRPLIRKPLTILVLDGNAPAVRFYRHIGAKFLMERPAKIDDTSIVELVFGLLPPATNDSRLAPRPTVR